MGQSRHFDRAPLTSGLPQLADILRVIRHVSKVPTAAIVGRRLAERPPWSMARDSCYFGAAKPGLNKREFSCGKKSFFYLQCMQRRNLRSFQTKWR
jgi:hypothetical protein